MSSPRTGTPDAAATRQRVRVPLAGIRQRVRVPLAVGREADFITFTGLCDQLEHLAIEFCASASDRRPRLVRIHSECLTGDLFGSLRCDCGLQLNESLALIGSDGGVLLYMRQEGRGIGLYRKLDAYKLQDAGLDTYEANLQLAHSEDARDYRAAVQMLNALQITTVRLITNNPDKVRALVENDIAVAEVIPTQTYVNKYNLKYLSAKRDRHKHALLLDQVGVDT